MSRVHRPQIPGVAFHITARTQGEEPWFTPELRRPTDEIITDVLRTSDVWCLGRTIMPNHFHLVIRQGMRPLHHTMQPIMRRIALLIQRSRGKKGHVFERRYRSHACESADHLRRAVCYTHNNPIRAQLCSDPCDYAWSTHVELLSEGDLGVTGLRITQTLKLFADSPGETPREWRDNYLRYLRWRMEKDRCVREGIAFDAPEPASREGDRHFMDAFCALPPLSRKPSRDLRDRAIMLLADMDPDCDIATLRRRRLGRYLTSVRRQLVAALLHADYQGTRIANYFGISDTTVSEIRSQLRYQR